jgi:hypothetical protein
MLLFDDSYESLRRILSHPDHLVIFFHVHKTAGTTVEKALASHYGDRAIACHNPSDRKAARAALEARTRPAGRLVVYGHDAASLREDLEGLGYRAGENLFRFTFVRHPVDRLESWNAFRKLREPTITESITEFAQHYRKYSLARHFRIEDDVADWMRDGIDFMGVCEDFERSAALLFQLLDLPALEVKSYNVNKGDKERLPLAALPQFLQRYRREVTMYELARAALSQACEAHLERAPVAASEIGSFAKVTRTNRSLEDNNDSYSLYLTGLDLFDADPERAKAFFEKALRRNIRFAKRIAEFLRDRDGAMLAAIQASIAPEASNDEDRKHVALLS